MKILLNSRQKVAIGVSALVIVGSWGFLALAPQTGVTNDITQTPVPAASEKPDTVVPSASPTPDINEEYKRIDDLKAGAALDMAMALVAQVAAIDYKKSPEEVIQAIRPYASGTVLSQVGERFLAINWADIEKRKYWLHAEVVNAEPLAPAGSTSNVPTKVRITVDLFEVNVQGDLNPMGRQIWEVNVGQGEGKNGWLATGLKEVG